ncbi:MAG: geranylgeranylglyceryl/heptaprenylglyceryl phosphate synthase [Ignisphaera sp.]|nr:geranylgeranylglyceryl/heptaprenylglyceryl phosphate synthase [Ignisphaera sp.]MCX8167995.1 geranylgeranylglyceryl/heptaprenylglyceryl phosphate synthase [Ignisphaera sp.]MDW8085534.1 geranylgeranylglyceryl/heptaprenylglyceryl phosphate synthase [Ignisphaera sp.]
MRWRGRVYNYIRSEIDRGAKLHFSLIDPEKVSSTEELQKILEMVTDAGTDAILIGGSLQVFVEDVTNIAKLVDSLNKPSILFPGSVSGLSPYADAILFISLLNSDDPYFIVGAQVYAAPLVRRFKLEVLPTGYVIVGDWPSSVSVMGRARPIPMKKPEIGAAYALAAKYMGMKFVYLEAGSGAPHPIPPSFIKVVKSCIDDTALIVGGGVRDSDTARELVKAGADIIVTGTVIEENVSRALDVIRGVKRF